MNVSTDIPDYILDLPLDKAYAEILRMTRNAKRESDDPFNGMYNKQGAQHIKYEDLGSYRGHLQGVMLRTFRRLVWFEQWAIHNYGRDFEGKRKRLDQYRAASARIYARTVEAMHALDKRSQWFLNRGLEAGNWITGQEVKYFVNRAKDRSKRPDYGYDVSIDVSDLLRVAKRQGSNECPCFGYLCRRVKGGKPKDHSLSLHRIDSTKGYEVGNVWFVSARANSLIQDMSSLELQFMADRYKANSDPRFETYDKLAQGQRYMEEQNDITPRLRHTWNVGKAVWSSEDEGVFYEGVA